MSFTIGDLKKDRELDMKEEDIQQFSFTTPKLEPIPEAEEVSNPSEQRSSQDANTNLDQNLS